MLMQDESWEFCCLSQAMAIDVDELKKKYIQELEFDDDW